MPTDTITADASPIRESARITALDAARGFALLGILLVNIQAFAEPFGNFILPKPESPDAATATLFYLVKVFAEGKFYPLFSILFGIGLVLQMDSVEAAGRSFRPLYLRRLFVLLVFGLLHALLLWYGDILFIYALCGTVLLLCSRLRGKTMLTIGSVLLLGVAVGGGSVFGLMSYAGNARPAPVSTAAAQDTEPAALEPGRPDDLDRLAKDSPFFTLINGFRDGRVQGGPEHPVWLENETRAYRDGPWLDSFLFRAMTWAFYLVFSLLGFGWSVLAAFFIGAGLARVGFFSPDRRPLRKRLVVIGLLIGLPAAAFGAFAPGLMPASLPAVVLAGFCMFAAGPLVALMYISAVTLIAESRSLRGVVRTLSAVGRMALTNYLTHTLVCTFIFYHWGLGQFAQWSRPERTLLVVGILAGQCVLSPLWLSMFRFGPMEWLWRTLTYWRLQPMRRSGADAAS
ncbi:MAG: DUF418 domain-containing protein [Phycisphaerales bacterium]